MIENRREKNNCHILDVRELKNLSFVQADRCCKVRAKDFPTFSMLVTCHYGYSFVGRSEIGCLFIKIKHRNSPEEPAIK